MRWRFNERASCLASWPCIIFSGKMFYVLQKGGDQTAPPDLTTLRCVLLNILEGQNCSSCALGPSTCSPPDRTTSQGFWLGLDGLWSPRSLNCRVTANGTSPTEAILAACGLWQCVITSMPYFCSWRDEWELRPLPMCAERHASAKSQETLADSLHSLFHRQMEC